uniref:Uncharacterized protein n=1 Tax=Arundo donax TaxID=35708 RepID=A0A0A9CC97_ARUDO
MYHHWVSPKCLGSYPVPRSQQATLHYYT